ncbi:hypothetical protein [Cupriavidus sp. H39]|uniref:hypothetical protein n=1 Tax=Cupriavidus sp. H39 TaxID=3401635 RepID=UPI003D06EC15
MRSAQFNIGGLTGWSMALPVRYALGDIGAEDPVVAQIHEIDTTVEVGGRFGYEHITPAAFPMARWHQRDDQCRLCLLSQCMGFRACMRVPTFVRQSRSRH